LLKNRKKYNRVALVISLTLLMIWAALGTGTSIAWFSDESNEVKNEFYMGEFDLELSYKGDTGLYEEVTPQTQLFDKSAIYEPGYIQIVYLKVRNAGNVPFDYKLAVDVNSANIAENVWGGDIYLPDHLRFGVIFGDSEAQLVRETAKISSASKFPNYVGSYPLNTYSEKDNVTLKPNEERYIAIIVRMPEEVGNAANYRGNKIPSVDLGIVVTASQEGTL